MHFLSGFAKIVFQKLTPCSKRTKHFETITQILDELLTVLTDTRRKQMPACILRYTISMKRLNAALEFTITSSLTSKRNMRTILFLRKSLPFQGCRTFTKLSSTFRIKEVRIRQQYNGKKTVGGVRQYFNINQKNK